MELINTRKSQFITFAFVALLEVLIGSSFTSAHFLSDVNNMLRDANPTISTFDDLPQLTALQLPQASRLTKEKLKATSSINDNMNSGVREEGKLLRFVTDNNDASELHLKPKTKKASSSAENSQLLEEQVRLLKKQLNALMNRRREDYELLERNLRKSLQITTTTTETNNGNGADKNLRKEVDQLRLEVRALADARTKGNKERVTVEWLQESVVEIRKQLVELQSMASSTAKDISHRAQAYEDLATIRYDFSQFKLELSALRERQQKNEILNKELREELMQQEEQYQHTLHHRQNNTASTNNEKSTMLANHNRRHCHFQREEIHELQLAQHSLKRQFNELKYHRIGERVRNVEIEQHRIANANFNLSRQIASLDKLHSSMLELLEDVENLQNKMDKNLPELRHEISKLEFTNVQQTAEQNLMREEGKNVARSLQAMAVSVSALQDERETYKNMQKTNCNHTMTLATNGENVSKTSDNSMVDRLSNVEQQYESIINKLPQDCSEIHKNNSTSSATDGLHLISLAGQHRPLLAHCTDDGWTTVQRRYDGSVNFNRSWEDYAKGFGTPAGEYWMGNEQLHHLTVNNCTGLRVVMQDIYDNMWLAEYDNFYVSSRADGYRLHIGSYSGNASDALNYQQGMQFSAIDVDRDISKTHCAANYEGGWWFSHCQHANLNGRYNLGLTWFDTTHNEWVAVKSSHMLVKKHFEGSYCDLMTRRDDGPEPANEANQIMMTSDQVNDEIPASKLFIVNGDEAGTMETTVASTLDL